MAVNFDDFQKVLATAQQSDSVKADLKRVLKKVNGALENLQASLSEMDSVLADDYVPAAPKTRKPRTPKAGAEADGAPVERKRPGRPKKNAA